jgi:hypothetical protein
MEPEPVPESGESRAFTRSDLSDAQACVPRRRRSVPGKIWMGQIRKNCRFAENPHAPIRSIRLIRLFFSRAAPFGSAGNIVSAKSDLAEEREC